MVNNGTLYYDHDRDGTHTQLAGCEARFRNVEHETYLAVRYENDKLSGINFITKESYSPFSINTLKGSFNPLYFPFKA